MKLSTSILLGTAVASLALAGCATAPAPSAKAATAVETDFAKINAINNAARGLGVTVVWIHYPQKVVPATGG